MMIQDCALVVPCGPWYLTFAPDKMENLSFFFSKNSYAGHPTFHTFRAVDSLGYNCHLTHHWLAK